jgi:hypothetical protein
MDDRWSCRAYVPYSGLGAVENAVRTARLAAMAQNPPRRLVRNA